MEIALNRWGTQLWPRFLPTRWWEKIPPDDSWRQEQSRRGLSRACRSFLSSPLIIPFQVTIPLEGAEYDAMVDRTTTQSAIIQSRSEQHRKIIQLYQRQFLVFSVHSYDDSSNFPVGSCGDSCNFIKMQKCLGFTRRIERITPFYILSE